MKPKEKRAARLEKGDYGEYDLIVVMDGGNRREAGSDPRHVTLFVDKIYC